MNPIHLIGLKLDEKTLSTNATSIVPLPHLEVFWSLLSLVNVVEYSEAQVLHCWRHVASYTVAHFVDLNISNLNESLSAVDLSYLDFHCSLLSLQMLFVPR